MWSVLWSQIDLMVWTNHEQKNLKVGIKVEIPSFTPYKYVGNEDMNFLHSKTSPHGWIYL
jgi:hypothetical protein